MSCALRTRCVAGPLGVKSSQRGIDTQQGPTEGDLSSVYRILFLSCVVVTASFAVGLAATSVVAQTDPAGTEAVGTGSDMPTPETESHLTGHGGVGPGPAVEGPQGAPQSRKLIDTQAEPLYFGAMAIRPLAEKKGGLFNDVSEEVRIQASPDEGVTGNVTGRILDGEGNELSDADVRLVNISSGTVEDTTSSNDRGEYSFGSVEPGRYRIEAELDGRANSVIGTVQAGTTLTREVRLRETGFYVSFETNSPVREGERLEIDATVTNTGDESGTQTVTAEVPRLGSDAEFVDLEGDASSTVGFEVPTGQDDSGEYTIEVSTEDDTEQKEVVVTDPEVVVSMVETNSPVTEGDSIEVDATIFNTDEQEVNGVVTAEVSGGLGQTGDRFSLLGGNEKTKTFRVQTERGDTGNYTVEVATEDDSDTAEVIITEGDRDTGTDLPEIEVTEETGEFVRFTLIDAGGLEDAYMTFEPDGWTSARIVAGLEKGASLTIRTEESAQDLLESEGVRVPDGVGIGLGGGSFDTREATEVDQATCLYDHDGFSFIGVRVPAEVDLPCHAPVLRGNPYVDGGTGVPISLQEGEYRFVGTVDGEERELYSHTVDSVEQDTDVSETENTDGEEESEQREAQNNNTTGDREESTTGGDGGGPEPLSLQEIGRYLGLASAFLIGFAVVIAASILVVNGMRDADWSLNETEESAEDERRRLVLDAEAKNEVYESWKGMIECADIEDVRTKTPGEISEEAKQAGLDTGAVEELCEVFEEVRYKDSEPTAEQEERAKRAFKRIKKSDRSG